MNRIRDVLNAVDRIQTYVRGMTFEQFAADRKTLDAVERNFIAIGEAVREVPEDVEQRHPDIPWGDMRAMRNFVVHVYWGVDSKRVWDTVHKDLPPLIPLLNELLDDTLPGNESE